MCSSDLFYLCELFYASLALALTLLYASFHILFCFCCLGRSICFNFRIFYRSGISLRNNSLSRVYRSFHLGLIHVVSARISSLSVPVSLTVLASLSVTSSSVSVLLALLRFFIRDCAFQLFFKNFTVIYPNFNTELSISGIRFCSLDRKSVV